MMTSFIDHSSTNNHFISLFEINQQIIFFDDINPENRSREENYIELEASSCVYYLSSKQ